MIEHDTRKEAKKLSEFITPEPLRTFIAEKVKGNNLNILDVSIGSGQLLFNLSDRISHVTGFDVSEKAVAAARQNFNCKSDIYIQDYITSEDVKKDICICNYPFSLKPTDEQKQYILHHDFLSQFYKGKVTGVLDFAFILKSFNAVKEGFYLCFPGIGYRQQEKKFREYLIDNQFIAELGIINNCNFEHTSISILYLHLTHEKSTTPKSFSLDLKTGELLEEVADFDNYQFNYPTKEVAQDKFDIVETEIEARKAIESNFKSQYEFSKMIWDLDVSLRNSGIQSPETWMNDFFKTLN